MTDEAPVRPEDFATPEYVREQVRRSLTDDLGDFPVVCTTSGIVMVLEAVLPKEDDRRRAAEEIYRVGQSVRIEGRSCAEHRTASCMYRPLRGPLFVPR